MALHSTKENSSFLLLSISSWTVNSMDPPPSVSFLILCWGLDSIIITSYLGCFKTLLPICLYRCLHLWEYGAVLANVIPEHTFAPSIPHFENFSSYPLPAGRDPNFLQRQGPGFTPPCSCLPPWPHSEHLECCVCISPNQHAFPDLCFDTHRSFHLECSFHKSPLFFCLLLSHQSSS